MATGWEIAVGAGPGVLALAGSLIGFGRLTQRLKAVEDDVHEMKAVVAQVGVIEERTKNTAEDVKEIRSGMSSLTQTLLDRTFEELRSFRPTGPARK